MSGRRLLFAQVLDDGDAPLGLFKCLAKKWAVHEAPQDFTTSRSLRLNADSTTGAVSDTGFPVLEALGYLVSRGAEGLNNIALLTINEYSLGSVLRSLFIVGGVPTRTVPASSSPYWGSSRPTGSPRLCDSRQSIFP